MKKDSQNGTSGKGLGGMPSTTGKPSGIGRDNFVPKSNPKNPPIGTGSGQKTRPKKP